MDNLIIRLAEENDLDSLRALYLEFHNFHAQLLPRYLRSLNIESPNEQQELKNRIMEIMQGNDSALLVADLSGKAIGFAEVYLRHTDPDNPAVTPMDYAHLQSLMVTQEFRHQGIGIQLLQTVEVWACEQGAVEIRLDIWEFSAGPLVFYEKSGYNPLRYTLVKRV
jgi:GNAT superfamily N-acetyltransferase